MPGVSGARWAQRRLTVLMGGHRANRAQPSPGRMLKPSIHSEVRACSVRAEQQDRRPTETWPPALWMGSHEIGTQFLLYCFSLSVAYAGAPFPPLSTCKQPAGAVCLAMNKLTTEAGDLRGVVIDGKVGLCSA